MFFGLDIYWSNSEPKHFVLPCVPVLQCQGSAPGAGNAPVLVAGVELLQLPAWVCSGAGRSLLALRGRSQSRNLRGRCSSAPLHELPSLPGPALRAAGAIPNAGLGFAEFFVASKVQLLTSEHRGRRSWPPPLLTFLISVIHSEFYSYFIH